MCYGCLVSEYDMTDEQIAETATHPAVLAVAAMIAHLRTLPECDTGGPIHVVVDDTNVEDEHLTLWDPTRVGFPPHTDEANAAAQAILDALRPLTIEERAVACVIQVSA